MKGQLHDTTHVSILKKSKSEIETKRVVAKGRDKARIITVKWVQHFTVQDEKVREICCTVL